LFVFNKVSGFFPWSINNFNYALWTSTIWFPSLILDSNQSDANYNLFSESNIEIISGILQFTPILSSNPLIYFSSWFSSINTFNTLGANPGLTLKMKKSINFLNFSLFNN